MPGGGALEPGIEWHTYIGLQLRVGSVMPVCPSKRRHHKHQCNAYKVASSSMRRRKTTRARHASGKSRSPRGKWEDYYSSRLSCCCSKTRRLQNAHRHIQQQKTSAKRADSLPPKSSKTCFACDVKQQMRHALAKPRRLLPAPNHVVSEAATACMLQGPV